MDTFVGLMEMAILFSGESAQKPKKGKGKSREIDENKIIKKGSSTFCVDLIIDKNQIHTRFHRRYNREQQRDNDPWAWTSAAMGNHWANT